EGSNRLLMASLAPQPEALDLAGRGLWELADELDPTRIFIGSNAIFYESLQLRRKFGARFCGILQNDEGLCFHKTFFILFSDDSGLEHSGMRGKRALDFEGRDPAAADFQHVIAAPAVGVIAIDIAHIAIAGARPRAQECFQAALTIPEISDGRRRAVYEQ